MEYYYTFTTSDDDRDVDIQAWVHSFDPDYAAAIFESVKIDTAQCSKEPVEGEIWMRDHSGLWYQVIYDSQESCDGCGTAFLGEEELGQACSDFSSWYEWGDYPWEEQ